MRGVTVRTAFHRMNFQFQPALPMRGVTEQSRGRRAGAVIEAGSPGGGGGGR